MGIIKVRIYYILIIIISLFLILLTYLKFNNKPLKINKNTVIKS